MKKIKPLLVAMAILFAVETIQAGQDGWNFELGAGVCGENVYPGSDEYYVVPVPNLKVSYTRGVLDYSLSVLEGASVTYTSPGSGFLVSFNVNAGSTRNSETYSILGIDVDHSDKTRKRLEGTPNLKTSATVETMLAYPTPVGLFGLSAAYHPTSVKYKNSGQSKETVHGFIYSALYTIGGPVTDHMALSGLVGFEFMDKNYADAWYGVDQPTEMLPGFKANAGWRSGMISVEVNYRLSKRIELIAVGGSTILLGDAQESPFTVEKNQHALSVQTVYRF